MVVTHLFQVMAFVVMEAADCVGAARDQRRRTRSSARCCRSTGQRGARQYVGYRDEDGVARVPTPRRSSRSRWESTTGAGLSACRSTLRTGKKMAQGQRIISIAIQGGAADDVPARFRGGLRRTTTSPSLTWQTSPRCRFVVPRQASQARDGLGQAVHAVLHPGDRTRWPTIRGSRGG